MGAVCALASAILVSLMLALALTFVFAVPALVATLNATSQGAPDGEVRTLASEADGADGPGPSGRGDMLERLRAARSIALEREILRIAREAATAAVRSGAHDEQTVPGGGRAVVDLAWHEGGSDDLLAAPAGAFVTLILDGKVRGCMGTVYPMEARLRDEIASAARMAARSDPRRPPLAPEELPRMESCVSVVGRVRRVQPDYVADPSREGVIVKSGHGSGVILPGEARTFAYELASAKREAGVGPGDRFELYVFETERFGRALPLRR